jgi:sortase A
LAVIWSKGRRYEYRIAQVLIVPEKQATPEQRRENVRYIEPTTEERLTLVSCWPRNDNSHRIIVIAFPLEDKAS